LLNEFLKKHRKVAKQQKQVVQLQCTISELKSAIAQQQKQIEALTAGVQKVSEKIELTETTPQLVADRC
jgi:predicted RNase H-like nuclease (RuvC/YqgF family)